MPSFRSVAVVLVPYFASKSAGVGLAILPIILIERGTMLAEASVGHEAGTCRMGTSEADSVTDSYGRLHETRNLYVADASLFPSSLDRHPTYTLLALVSRIAKNLIRRT